MNNKEKARYAIISTIVAILLCFSYLGGLFHGLETFLEDTLFSPKPIDQRLVIVAIDDKSIQQIGQWPWPRKVFADFVEKLNKDKPLSLGIDVIWSEESRVGKFDDTYLANAFSKVDYPVVLATQADNLNLDNNGKLITNSLLKPLSQFQNKNVSLGLVNVVTDNDGVTRKYFKGKLRKDDVEIIPFAEQLLLVSEVALLERKINPQTNPERIYFAGSPGSIRTISFADILYGNTEKLKDKIILLGATAPSLHDSQKVPTGGGREMSGVEIHGQIANMFLSNLFLTDLKTKFALIWIILASFVSCLLFFFIRRIEFVVLTNVIIGIIYLIGIIILFDKGAVVNMIHVTLSWGLTTLSLGLYKSLIGEKERKIIKATFSKYVSPHVLEELLTSPEKVVLGGEEKEITVLFSDIRGFTSISEKTTPTELVRILNMYFSAVTKKIIEKDGVLDKYIGDAIMAFWGAPLGEPLQADKAVEAGLGMLEALDELNVVLRTQGDPEIKIGVGIYTGKAVVGNVGSEHRFDYTAIGDTVNASSRIEGITKEYKTPLIIGDTTLEKIVHKEKFETKPLGEVLVKGKSKPILIYAVTRANKRA
ncbi:MAG: adenylate/guanylate cyclase domain-containing protein [Patescibacteria group bacterium]